MKKFYEYHTIDYDKYEEDLKIAFSDLFDEYQCTFLSSKMIAGSPYVIRDMVSMDRSPHTHFSYRMFKAPDGGKIFGIVVNSGLRVPNYREEDISDLESIYRDYDMHQKFSKIYKLIYSCCSKIECRKVEVSYQSLSVTHYQFIIAITPI